jgi:hypothetical protein
MIGESGVVGGKIEARGGGIGAMGEDLELGARPQARDALGGQRSDMDDDGLGSELRTDLGYGVVGGVGDERDEIHAC